MKIKYEWEKEDLKCGSYISRQSWPEDSDDISGLCSVTYKIGWQVGSSQCMAMVSISDGMIHLFKETDDADARQLMIDDFNNDQHGYRPLTKEQVIRRLDYLLP